jgi:hypothetical protein
MIDKNEDTIKEKWECPSFYLLKTRETKSGTPPNTPEEMTYDPVISP